MLFAAYYVTAVLITLNMLIAMMADSYQKIAVSAAAISTQFRPGSSIEMLDAPNIVFTPGTNSSTC